MSNVPEDLHYTKDHEWVRIEGKKATIGITDHAQHELTDIVFIELPKVGAALKAHDKLGVVESVKSASEIYAPLSGTVVEVNGSLSDSPELINKDPYGKGWIAREVVGGSAREEAIEDATVTVAAVGSLVAQLDFKALTVVNLVGILQGGKPATPSRGSRRRCGDPDPRRSPNSARSRSSSTTCGSRSRPSAPT